jgi:hypothetical protein
LDQLPLGLAGDPGLRAALVARWLRLTREALPAMARQGGWRVRHDHCFMRICLDAAAGGRWDRRFPPPAIRRAPDDVLARAVAVAERIAAEPGCLASLDAASRAGRRGESERPRFVSPSGRAI